MWDFSVKKRYLFHTLYINLLSDSWRTCYVLIKSSKQYIVSFAKHLDSSDPMLPHFYSFLLKQMKWRRSFFVCLESQLHSTTAKGTQPTAAPSGAAWIPMTVFCLLVSACYTSLCTPITRRSTDMLSGRFWLSRWPAPEQLIIKSGPN